MHLTLASGWLGIITGKPDKGEAIYKTQGSQVLTRHEEWQLLQKVKHLVDAGTSMHVTGGYRMPVEERISPEKATGPGSQEHPMANKSY